jgi:RNA polymerase sigma-70 factor, ECF subfamily
LGIALTTGGARVSVDRVSDLQELQRPLRDLHLQFHALIEPHRPDLYRYCLRLTNAPFDAEDLVQETLARAFARLVQHYQPVEPRPYLFRIASNLWIDQHRRARKLTYAPLQENIPVDLPQPEQNGAVQEAFGSLVDLLEPRQRVAVLLKDVFDYTIEEIATFLETTPGAVKGLLHRGRARIEQSRRQPPRTPDAASMSLARRYAERLSAADWDGIAALLRADATVSIVGVDEEHGRDYIRATSLSDAATDLLPGHRAEFVLLDGEPLVLWLFRPDDGDEAVRDVLRITTDDDAITHVWMYWFCPDVVREVARRLGRRAEPVGMYSV